MGHLLDTWGTEFSQVGERLTSPKRKKNKGVQKYSWPLLLGHAVVIETGKCGRRRCNDRERHDVRVLVQHHFSLVIRPQEREQPRIERRLGALARLVLAQGNGAADDRGLKLDLRILLQEGAGEQCLL